MNRKEAEELLYREEERRSSIMHDLNFSLTLLGILVGVMYFYMSSYTSIELPNDTESYSWSFYAFLILVGISTVLMVLSVLFIAIVFTTNKFSYYPKAQDLYSYFNSIMDFYNGNEALARKEYDTEIMKRAIEATDTNQDVNQKRKLYTQWTIRMLFSAFISLFLALVPYLFLPKNTSPSISIDAVSDTIYTCNTGSLTNDYIFIYRGDSYE